MEAGLFLTALLLSCTSLHASTVGPDTCTLQQTTSNEKEKVSYRTGKAVRGCVSSSTMARDQEVHVLSVKNEKELWTLQLNVSSAGRTTSPKQKVLFVITCEKYCVVMVHSEALHLTFVLKNVRVLGGSYPWSDFNVSAEEPSGEKLVEQVKLRYGGITSFAELENPHCIYFQVGEDDTSPEECIVQPGFNTWPYLQTEHVVQEVKHYTSSGEKTKEARILRVQQGPETSAQLIEVKVDVVCPGGKPLQDLDTLLILQGQPSIIWKIDTKQNSMKFQTSGKYLISKFTTTQINGSLQHDDEQGLISLACEKASDVALYAPIPSASEVTLQLHKCAQQVTTAPPTPKWPPHLFVTTFFHLNQPWRCTDDSIELDMKKEILKTNHIDIRNISLLNTDCSAEQNSTHFMLKRYLGDCRTELEGNVRARNELLVTLASREKVLVPFHCDLPQKLHLQLYKTQNFKWPPTTVLEVNKPAYVQVSFRTPTPHDPLVLKECSLQTASEEPRQLTSLPETLLHPTVSTHRPTQDTLGRELYQFSFIYSPAGGKPLPPRVTLLCRVVMPFNGDVEEVALDVTLQDATPSPSLGIEAVVGITFAAFLIGTLLTAALWCIYSHTRPTANMQPITSAPPASESSSTNHSIGSTQSTPCSTSSMA